MKKKEYEVPLTTYSEVELEQGFMEASVFSPDDNKDQGVSIEQHEVNPTIGNYFDNDDSTKNGWDN